MASAMPKRGLPILSRASPLLSSSSPSSSSSAFSPPHCNCTIRSTVHRLQQVRHEASARRHTKKLRIHPHPSFKSSPSAAGSATHIVFNPPSSAPTPYVTPKAFLPASDPRLSFPSLPPPEPFLKPTINAMLSTTPPLKKKLGVDGLPPPIRPSEGKKYHLTQGQVEKIKKLRGQNPEYWTRDRLAEKYGCSQFFVGMVAPVTKERKESEFAKIDAVKANWGPGRKDARRERARRRVLWSKDLD